LNIFLILSYKTFPIYRGLNSPLAQSAAELWLTNICSEGANYTFEDI